MTSPILLHTCCAPCVSAVVERLEPAFQVTAFFYNPNIAPLNEYRMRLEELRAHGARIGFPVIEGERDTSAWKNRIGPFRFLGERSPRCHECYRVRLEGTFAKAKELGISVAGTALSISPHKDARVINAIGAELSRVYGIDFFQADFKKQDGFKRSVELSREYDFYRQNYCGCIFSKLEREKNPRWLARAAENAKRNS